MRLLAVLFVLLSMPALAVSALAQQSQQQAPRSGSASGSGSGSTSGSGSGSQGASGQRHPGDYCTAHCRANEIPCGRGCMSSKGGAKCMAKFTTTCPGKP